MLGFLDLVVADELQDDGQSLKRMRGDDVVSEEEDSTVGKELSNDILVGRDAIEASDRRGYGETADLEHVPMRPPNEELLEVG